jgi:hypothetical protein
MKKLLPLLVLLMTVKVIAQTSGPLLWNRIDRRAGITTPGGAPFDKYKDVKVLSSGNTIALGEVGGIGAASGGDIVLRKHDNATGAVLSERIIDGYTNGTPDRAVKLLVSEPYIYVITNAQYFLSPFDDDFFIYKLDTAFNDVWSAIVNTPGDPNDVAVDAGLDLFGNLYVVGNTSRTASGGDIVLYKYSSSGTALFTKYYTSTGNFNDAVTAMAVEPNGSCNITGFYTSATLGSRMLALKLWGNGVQLWVRYHDVVSGVVSPDVGNSVSYDPVTGDMYICGTGLNSSGNDDWVVVKFAGIDGTKNWFKRHSGTNNANDSGVEVVYANGNLYSAGTFASSVSGVVSQNVQLRKYNPADGASLWTKTYNILNGTNGPSTEAARTMIVSPAGVVYVGGVAVVPSFSASTTYQVVLAYSSSGTLLWAHNQPNGAAFSAVQGIDVSAIDFSPGQNTLFVAGSEWGSISIIGYSSLLKFGPASLTPVPIARISDGETNIDSDRASILFPNPASDFLGFRQFSGNTGLLTLSDLSGRILREVTIQDEFTSLDVQALPSGLYLLRFTQGDKTECLRFVKH